MNRYLCLLQAPASHSTTIYSFFAFAFFLRFFLFAFSLFFLLLFKYFYVLTYPSVFLSVYWTLLKVSLFNNSPFHSCRVVIFFAGQNKPILKPGTILTNIFLPQKKLHYQRIKLYKYRFSEAINDLGCNSRTNEV